VAGPGSQLRAAAERGAVGDRSVVQHRGEQGAERNGEGGRWRRSMRKPSSPMAAFLGRRLLSRRGGAELKLSLLCSSVFSKTYRETLDGKRRDRMSFGFDVGRAQFVHL
jgi:hypothetical protein